jgi:hypothetical protein
MAAPGPVGVIVTREAVAILAAIVTIAVVVMLAVAVAIALPRGGWSGPVAQPNNGPTKCAPSEASVRSGQSVRLRRRG